MKNLPILMGLFLAVAGAAAEPVIGPEAVEVNKLSDRVIVLRLAADPGENNIVALKSDKGIVVIDTHLSPFGASLIRQRVLQEFKANTIAYVINTHSHGDHAFGNQTFADALIIGHENSLDEISQAAAKAPAVAAQLKAYTERLKASLEGMDKSSDKAKIQQQRIDLYAATIQSLEEGFRFTPPTLTFSDKMALNLGDIHLELMSFGLSHSRSDILIFCPEEKLLLTGDLFSKGRNLYVDSERIQAIPRWKESLEKYSSPEKTVASIIPGHGDYLDMGLLAGNLAFVKEKEKEFGGKRSTFFAVRDLYEREGMDSAVKALREMASRPETCFTLHPELDSFAYRLMLAGKLDDAQKMMEALAEIFPDQDNAFDSLGELFLRRNDKDRAAQCFKRALELNPDNRNAEAKLKELKK